MTRRLAIGLAFLAAPAIVHAQGLTIDHKPVACIVAGQFPKLNACFAPAGDVARGRLYFKATLPKASPHTYWVDFKSESPCFTAILPKPMKSITQMMYYVEVADKKFEESRTEDRLVKIVPNKGGCDKDMPVAGWVQNASVVVGAPAGAPAVPLGFAGTGIVGVGGGGGALIGASVLGGGAAIATTVIVVNNNNNNDTPTPTPGPSGSSQTPTPTPVPSPTATPTPRPTPTNPPTPFRFSCFVSPTIGTEPLLVTFDCCASTGANLRYEFDFDGDGVEDARNVCRAQRLYKLSGVFSPSITNPPQTTTARDFVASVTVREALADGNRDTQSYRITVESAPGLTIEAARPSSDRRVSMQVDLDAAESAQVVLNGSAGAYARRGRTNVAAAGRRGTNRVEVQLVQGSGPGNVTVDLRSMPTFVPGSLRVVAGELVSLSDTTITFRLKGRSGERVVFTVEAAD
jgi:hypothetical protein